MSKTLKASAVREDFAETLNRVAYQRERIILERHGKPIAALVPIEELQALEILEDKADVAAARKALKSGKLLPYAKVRKSLGL